ncbi:hypothetical protein IKF15_01055 [Candidatus Saccharibacteria bacterium]|nr:hypothetical protein [Candidatus Saccharibacteria bacterium]
MSLAITVLGIISVSIFVSALFVALILEYRLKRDYANAAKTTRAILRGDNAKYHGLSNTYHTAKHQAKMEPVFDDCSEYLNCRMNAELSERLLKSGEYYQIEKLLKKHIGLIQLAERRRQLLRERRKYLRVVPSPKHTRQGER